MYTNVNFEQTSCILEKKKKSPRGRTPQALNKIHIQHIRLWQFWEIKKILQELLPRLLKEWLCTLLSVFCAEIFLLFLDPTNNRVGAKWLKRAWDFSCSCFWVAGCSWKWLSKGSCSQIFWRSGMLGGKSSARLLVSENRRKNNLILKWTIKLWNL